MLMFVKRVQLVTLALYVHTWACMCMYAFVYVCMYVCMYGCVHVCMYACMYVCIGGTLFTPGYETACNAWAHLRWKSLLGTLQRCSSESTQSLSCPSEFPIKFQLRRQGYVALTKTNLIGRPDVCEGLSLGISTALTGLAEPRWTWNHFSW